MTVGVVVKVYDGIVLAADSATTLVAPNNVAQVYNNADKVFQLHRTLPIGAMTWGLGQIGAASIATLAKDLRRRFMGKDPLHQPWELDPATYTISGVVDRLVEMMYVELYQPLYSGRSDPNLELGFVVAGYSSGATKGEVHQITIVDSATAPKVEVEFGPDDHGWAGKAQAESIGRLFNGFDPRSGDLLAGKLSGPDEALVLSSLSAHQVQPVTPAMPFADAINLARFCADVAIGYRHYSFGPDTVGGPVEIAGISRHEGFKWIARKHYYPPELNPTEPHP